MTIGFDGFNDYVGFRDPEDEAHNGQFANPDGANSGTSGPQYHPSTKYHDDKAADQAAETVVLDLSLIHI